MNSDNLKIITWNSRGLAASIPYLRSLIRSSDIICLTEHWLHANRLTKLADIAPDIDYFGRSSNFSSSECYGYSKGQGGVAILWDKNLKSVTPLVQIKHDRVCGIRIQNEASAVINIFCIYLPARGCDEDIATTLDELGAILDNTEIGSHNILCGDMNADMGSKGGPKSKKIPDIRGNRLHNFIVKYSLTAVNLCKEAIGPINTHFGPTGQTCIDYILIPSYLVEHMSNCTTVSDDPLNTSDHLPVKININLGMIPRGCCEGVPVDKIRWDKLDSRAKFLRYEAPLGDSILELMHNINMHDPTPELVEYSVEQLVRMIRHHDQQIPRSRFKRNIKPFWCDELNELKRQKILAYKAWCRGGRPRDPTNVLFINNRVAKRNFRRRIKRISKEYDEKKITEAIKSAEMDRSIFWKILKRERDGPKIRTPSVKNSQGRIVHKIEEILLVWEEHFSTLGTPVQSPNFDNAHYVEVTEKVKTWLKQGDIDDFSRDVITEDEIQKGLNTLNSGKTPGIDGVTKEHLMYAGRRMIEVLCLIFNLIICVEHIPTNFLRAVQIPLYKGKNAPIVEVNNYRGITLLSTLNKLFEIVIWKRLEKWWVESGVLSQLQGACRKGVSCIHTAMLLQETISSFLHQNKKVFVTYLDVSKAFDGVWIDGLFFRLWQIGIRGRTWRLLYKTYVDFKCKARVQGVMSNWYTLRCGIHQGGYLSLMKYLAFINTLLINLEDSGLCCSIGCLNLSPLGYADDVAAASLGKYSTDRILDIAFKHSCKWRYKFNSKKSAVLVYGESINERKSNSLQRVYRLGKEPIKEQSTYEHLGLQNFVSESVNSRLIDKISKGRKALNAASGIGLKPGGLTIHACSILFWAMIVPIITFSCELWVINDNDVRLLEEFQRYAGRRIQRLPYRSPNETSYVGLGWIRLEIFIYVKKALFVRGIAILADDVVYKQLFLLKLNQYEADKVTSCENRSASPIFDIIRIVDLLGLFNEMRDMMYGIRFYNKRQWKDIVWRRAWDIERQDWAMKSSLFSKTKTISSTSDNGRLLIWWQLADIAPNLMKQCEVMVKIVCRASRLKVDCYQYRKDPINRTYCELCSTFANEDARHLLLQCPALNGLRTELFDGIERIEYVYNVSLFQPKSDVFETLMGKIPSVICYESQVEFLKVIAMCFYKMYYFVLNERSGVG